MYILGFADHRFSVVTTHLRCCSTKLAMGNTQVNEHGCVTIKLYLGAMKCESVLQNTRLLLIPPCLRQPFKNIKPL